MDEHKDLINIARLFGRRMNAETLILRLADALEAAMAALDADAYRKGQEDMRERAAGVANDGVIATEDDGIAAWVRDRIIEDAATRFVEMVLKEAHDSRIKPLQDRIEELEADLSAAREQVAGAYEVLRTKMIGAWHFGYEHGKYLACDNPIACCDKEVEMAIPADATAALEARDARVRAEERAKVIEEAKAVCAAVVVEREAQVDDEKYDVAAKARFRAGILQAKLIGERLHALHTDERRKAGGQQ